MATKRKKSSPPPAAKSSTVRLALIQARASKDPDENVARTVEKIGEAARRGARLVCTQELFRSPYFCQTEDAANFDLAETVPGPTTRALADAAKKHGVVVVGSLF